VTIAARFDAFHKDNPHIWILFCRFAYEAIRGGVPRFSARFICERIRWEVRTTTSAAGAGMPGPATGRAFKINNDFTSRYGRKFKDDFPHLAHYLELRSLKTL
jgi:hypothetical protein